MKSLGAGARSQLAFVVGAAVAYTVPSLISWLQPVLTAELMTRHGATETQAGLVATVEMSAVALASLTAPRVFRGRSLQLTALGAIAVTVVITLIGMGALTLSLLMACRAACGLAEGSALAASSAALARTHDPDRAFGQANVVSIVVGAILIYLAPFVGMLTGGAATFPTLAAALLVLAPALLLIPREAAFTSPEQALGAANAKGVRTQIAVICVGVFLIAVSSASMWAFYIPLGLRSGLKTGQIDLTLSLAAISSIVGSLGASWLGSRRGHLRPLAAGALLLTIAVSSLCLVTSPVAFIAAAVANMISLYFLLPYFFGFAAVSDPSGSGVATVAAGFLLTMAAGPYLGGLLIGHLGFGRTAAILAIGNAVGFATLCLAARLHAPHPDTDSPHVAAELATR